MSDAPQIRRAMLYVPASSEKMLEKSRGLKVDCVVYDLEDSVAVDKKASARKALREFLDGPRPENVNELAVRINSVDSGYAMDDLTEILQAANVDMLVIPKTQSASDLQFITNALHDLQPERHPREPKSSSSSATTNGHKPQTPVRIMPLIESAKGLMNLKEICASTPYIAGLVFAAEDFALDLSITRTPDLSELLYARSAIVATSRAFELPSTIDLVCTAFKGEDGQKKLEEESLGGKRLGFNGKQLIHPGQIEIVQKAFSPEQDEVEWAVRVVIASEKAKEMGKGAWSLDGSMIDVPVISRAKGIVSKAELCGFDLDQLKEKHKDQKPE